MHQIMLSMHGSLPKVELLLTSTVLNMIYFPAVVNHKDIYISRTAVINLQDFVRFTAANL